RALRRDLDHVADREGWTGVGSVFGDVGLSYSRNTATEKDSGHSDVTRGWELELPIPLFDWGGAASGRARAEVQRSAALLQDGAVRARSEARTAWRSYRTAWDLAHQQQAEVLPLARFVQDETVLRYNGMLASVWELLAQARNATQAVATATQAQRDFWLADTDLQLALTGTSPGALQGISASAAPPPTRPKAIDMNRRTFFTGAATAVSAASVSRVAMAALPEPATQSSADTAAPLVPPNGRPYQPVVTLNGWTTPWRMNAGVKEFHLVAEPVVREVAPGFFVNMWGYNGQSPGPTIEVVEGDRVRIFVTNRLPEHTSVHWHGQRLPSGMDGVAGLTQPHIPPGKTFVYEFTARRPGTFMYHPHADEMVQMAMGMMGLWITHPKAKHPLIADVQRDYAWLLAAYAVEAGSMTPRVNEMTDFNIWTFNSRVFPAISPLVARRGDRVRMRVGNLTMTNHPIHIHGHEFEVTGTDGGPVPRSARWPEVTTDVAVGQMRQAEFIADELGDWALHCHKSHHTMGAMGHDVPTMIGVDHRGLVGKIQKIVPDYMVMGERGMADMGAMEMPLPDNTFPMMTGTGPFGPLEMGGMFTTLKVRQSLGAGDYRDPGWYQHPAGTVAREWTGGGAEGSPATAPRQTAPG
ncbi:MAG: multicopper oxidase domain-containing protein, partial [Burkholderiaceae bacterium]